eukprot:1160281-Amphidinium_carterae.1
MHVSEPKQALQCGRASAQPPGTMAQALCTWRSRLDRIHTCRTRPLNQLSPEQTCRCPGHSAATRSSAQHSGRRYSTTPLPSETFL